MKPPAARTAAAWYAALEPGASRTAVAPTRSAIWRQQRRELVVALDRDGGAPERGDRPFRVGEGDQRMEPADLGPGGHRRLQDLGAQGAAGVDHGLAAVHPDPPRHRLDGVVGDGQDDELDLLDEGLRLGEGPDALDQAREPLAATDVAAGDGMDRPAGTAQGDAEGGPDRARPDDARVRRLARQRVVMGMRVVGRRVSSPCGWWPGGTGSRSIPAASMAASVSARARRAASPGRSSHAFTGQGPGRARYACIHRSLASQRR